MPNVNLSTVDVIIENDIARIYLNRPERLNAVNPQLVEDLCQALDESINSGAKVIILAGRGRAFCAGHDLKQDDVLDDEVEHRRRLQRIQDVTRKIRQAPCPVIAAVHGYALGAGCEFALGADLIIATRDAQFGFPEVSVGLSVTGGISHILPMAIGLAKAKELVFLSKRFTATEAETLGLINKVVESEQLEAEALQLAEALSSMPRLALTKAKIVFDHGSQSDLESAFKMEIEHALLTSGSSEAKQAADNFRKKENK